MPLLILLLTLLPQEVGVSISITRPKGVATGGVSHGPSILLESGSYLLLESGDHILREES
jgi:hypothetical protein